MADHVADFLRLSRSPFGPTAAAAHETKEWRSSWNPIGGSSIGSDSPRRNAPTAVAEHAFTAPARFQRQAPEVYERLPEVLAAHGATIRVKHTRSLGVAMAGHDVVDPYKD